MTKKLGTETVSLEELFGIECNDRSGKQITVERYLIPNEFTPTPDSDDFQISKDHLKAILLGLVPELGFRVRFVGPPGCGKTDGLAYVLNKLNWGLINFECCDTNELSDLTGFWVNRKDGMERIDGPLVQFFKHKEFPISFCFEEMDALPPGTLLGCNAAVQSNRLTLFDGPSGIEVVTNINNKPIFSTGNTVSGYDPRGVMHGVQRQNMAALSRWVVHELDYLDYEAECRLVKNVGLPEQAADVLVKFAGSTRQAYVAGSPSISRPMVTREVLFATHLTLIYEDMDQAVRMAYFAKLESVSDRKVVQEIYQRHAPHGDLFTAGIGEAA